MTLRKKIDYILEQFWIYSKTEQKIQFPYFPPHPTTRSLLHYQNSIPEWHICQPTLTHCYHSESIVYIKVHCWGCTVSGFGHIYTDILEKAMACHSNTLAWKIPWTEESGRLPSMGSLRVRYD